MSRKPRAKPKSPEQIAADRLAARVRDLEAVNIPADLASLATGQDIEVVRAGDGRDAQRVSTDSARRLDAFAALRESMRTPAFAGCYDIARRFEHDLAVSHGEHDKGKPMERVDGGQGGAGRIDQMIAATKQLEAVRAHVSGRDWWLLSELARPTRIHATWRHAVAYVTGEENWNAQGAVVRAACVNLRDAYRAEEARPKRAA